MNAISALGRWLPTTLTALLCQGCLTGLVRDQAQVDPVVSSDHGVTSWQQPTPRIPDCTVQFWMQRAINGEGGGCDFSGSGSRNKTTPPQKISLPRIVATGPDLRSQAQLELVGYADLICAQHLASIYGTNAGLNFMGGLATTLFSGGAAVATGRTATNLAAGSALFSGTRSLMNSEIYYGYIGPAVITELRALRIDMLTQMASKRLCPLNLYPAQEAINDALNYHDTCSFATGLASLLNKAGVTRVSEDKLRTSQLAALSQQVDGAKAELVVAKAELTADSDNKVLLGRVEKLQAQIREAEAVQRFSGVVDPNAGRAAGPAYHSTLEALNAQIGALESIAKRSAVEQKQLDSLIDARAGVIADAAKLTLARVGYAAELHNRAVREKELEEWIETHPHEPLTHPNRVTLQQSVADSVIALQKHAMVINQLGGVVDPGNGELTLTGQSCTKPIAQAGTSH